MKGGNNFDFSYLMQVSLSSCSVYNRVVTRYMGPGINDKKWPGIRDQKKIRDQFLVIFKKLTLYIIYLT